ncbi:MmgE/PrpD family protein [Phaeacidiphilus oryzae]|uniref:MmgE/PrpD family protein n=1 Tax=Phaeacidiphilus oryzae TaxID=348818 RepID=UPI000689810F|nr:MmgE/PrpD family protein [Phaeacidiphilus oryzae]
MSEATATPGPPRPTVAATLAAWAHGYRPDADDLALADRALTDTLAVALAAREDALRPIAAGLPAAARWAAMAHVLDFDDLHTDTTTHISVVTVPAVLAAGGGDAGARAYLAGAGVFARLAARLGWRHYAEGWHITCTAGAPAAAVAAGVAYGLTPEQLATAMALAVPAAGGVQEAFGTHGKSLQVGFAAEAGVRAARLARAGATADPRALDSWLRKLGADPEAEEPLPASPAVPGGLAIKLFPCCYAMQRPIAALRELKDRTDGREISRVTVTTPAGTVHPLIHARPSTGLEGKFSLPYAVATALVDDYPGFAAFTDASVRRPEARALIERTAEERLPIETENLLEGEVSIEVELAGGERLHTAMTLPPGAPGRPPTDEELAGKLAACGPDVPALLAGIDWTGGAELLAKTYPLTLPQEEKA